MRSKGGSDKGLATLLPILMGLEKRLVSFPVESGAKLQPLTAFTARCYSERGARYCHHGNGNSSVCLSVCLSAGRLPVM